MDNFLQTYGIWLLFGLVIFFMFRMHKGAGGCCGTAHGQASNENATPKEPEDADGRQNG